MAVKQTGADKARGIDLEENAMSSQELLKDRPETISRPAANSRPRVDLGGRYRKIGISAVAAAVRYQGADVKSAAVTEPSTPSAPKRTWSLTERD